MVKSEFALEPVPPFQIPSAAPETRRYTVVVVAALTVVYGALIALQITRNLWFDELLTLFIARENSWSQLLYLVHRWDLNPPVLHVLAHLSLGLVNGNPIAIRIPSVIEFYGASMLLLVYAARKLGWAFAPLPVILLWYSPLLSFATEARPYAALCFWFCALLVLWDSAVSGSSGQRPKILLAGVALAATGLLTTHVLAPLSLLPFFAAEVVRFRQSAKGAAARHQSGKELARLGGALDTEPVLRESLKSRRTDISLWVALGAPLVSTLIYLPFFSNFSGITEYPPAFQAGFQKVASFYWHTSLDVLAAVVLGLVAVWLLRRRGAARPLLRNSRTTDSPAAAKSAELVFPSVPRPAACALLRFSTPEIVLWATLLCVPVLLDLVMMAQRAPFWGRYCITSALGLYFVCTCLLAGVCGGRKRAGYAALSAVGVLLFVQRIAIPAYAAVTDPRPHKFAAVEAIDPDLPLVAASGLTWGEMGFYESPATRARLFYLLDRPAAIQFAHATIFEDLAEFQRSFQLPGTVESFEQFTKDHKHFLVIGTVNYPEDWLLRKLAAAGAQIRLLGRYSTPYKDKSLFDVRVR